MKRKIVIIVSILIFITIGFVFWFFIKSNNQQEPNNTQNQNQEQLATTTTDNTTSSQELSSDFKTYRNEQYGFEFQYPKEKLTIKENSFGSYYSKFNLDVFLEHDRYIDSAFLVNVVLPEFADKTFINFNSVTSTIVIDGVSGIKYIYKFEALEETAIVLPLGEYKIILGTTEPYKDIFDKIIPTFKFTK